MEKAIRVGIVGAGFAARIHTRDYGVCTVYRWKWSG